MKTLVITRGLPASGKTTWAHKIQEENPGSYKVICKDDLRAMLDNSKWSGPNEKFVLEVRDMIILKALQEGKHVIIADTNLNPVHIQHIRQLVKENKETLGDVDIVLEDFTLASVEECIKRDLKRNNPVGERVIREQYKKWLYPDTVRETPKYDVLLPDAIIVDVDGTLALHNGRNPFDFEKLSEDKLNDQVASLLISMQVAKSDLKVLIVTGREYKYVEETSKWLTSHGVYFDRIFCRTDDDKRNDAIIKEEIYDNHIYGKYNIRFVLDDRNRTVEKWRQLGLTCLQVADGNF